MNPFLEEVNQKIDAFLKQKHEEIFISGISGISYLSDITDVPQHEIQTIRQGKMRLGEFNIGNFYKILMAVTTQREAIRIINSEKSIEEIIKTFDLPDILLAHVSKKMAHMLFQKAGLWF